MDRNKELQEAIRAGERALFSLNAAQGQLNSAKNWGFVDLLGGGLFTGLMKHSKLENASSNLEEARRDLQRFQRELQDVTLYADIRLDIGDFLTFADFFFDGLIADYLVQSRIRDTAEQVEQAIHYVEQILSELRASIERY